MGCQGGRGSSACVLVALLVGALAWSSPASASTITVADVRVGEGSSATFTLTRKADALAPARTISFQAVDGSARAPGDYAAANGSLAFEFSLLGGTQTRQVTVAVAQDALDEADETFRLVIAGPEVADGEAVATIADNDPSPAISVADAPPVAEGATAAKATFAITLSAPSGRPVSVAYETVSASATAGQDYAAIAGTLVMPAGATRADIDVAVADDSADEPAESFALRLSAPVFASLGRDVATATIADDDEPPALATGDTKPAVTTSPGSPQSVPFAGQPGGTSSRPTTGSSSAGTALGVSSPRLKRPSTVLMTLSCPQSAGRCSGRITLFSVPNKRSRIKALRRERRLGRVTFAIQGGRAQTLELSLGRTDRSLLRRTGRMRVRAYATTQDAAGRTGVRAVSGTLIARTAHSSPSRS